MLKWLRSIARRTKTPGVGDWFHISWDDEAVHLDVAPPRGEPWRASFEWSSVRRVCFKAEDMWASDGIYVFTSQRPESYAVPIEAGQGLAFWEEIRRRGLFDASLAAEAVSALEGLYCWPPNDKV